MRALPRRGWHKHGHRPQTEGAASPRRGLVWVAVLSGLALGCQLLTWPPATVLAPTASPTRAPSPAVAGTPPPPLLTLAPTITVVPTGAPDAAGLLPEFAADADLGPGFTRYWIQVTVDFTPGALQASLAGQARIRFVVPPGENLEALPLMLWPNDPQYHSRMQAGPALVNGVRIEPRTDLDGIALWLALDPPASPGDTLDISLPFEIEARGPIGGPQPRRFGITEGVLIAPTFYPLVPRRVDGAWQVEAAPDGGDTTNSDVAYYQVDLTVPAGLGLAASGVEVDRQETGGRATARYVSGPMRDFAFALGPFDLTEATVDGVRVRAWALTEHRDDAEEMLQVAAVQLALLNELVGPYPYAELDLVDAPGAFGGIEYPGLVFIGTLGSPWLIEPTVHEVAHQWFYGLVGGDQLHEPWLDEALATYSEVLYYEEEGRPGSAAGILTQFRSWVRSHPDPTLPIGLGVGDYPDPETYWLIVYRKGALFLDALRGEIGDRDFERFLQDYYAAYRYGFASGADFQRLAEASCSCDLDSLFDLWVWKGGEVPGV